MWYGKKIGRKIVGEVWLNRKEIAIELYSIKNRIYSQKSD